MNQYHFNLSANQNYSFLNKIINESVNCYDRAVQAYQKLYDDNGKHMSLFDIMKGLSKKKEFCHLTQNNVDDLFFRVYEHLTKEDEKECKYSIRFWTDVTVNDNCIHIKKWNVNYRFDKTSDIKGIVKSVTIIRTENNKLSVVISTTEDYRIVGFDWGIKTYLTGSDGSTFDSSHFFTQNKKEICELKEIRESLEKGSEEYVNINKEIDLLFENVRIQRRDWQYWFAHFLCRKYDLIFLETLPLARIWATRKSLFDKKYDFQHSEFVNILERVSKQHFTMVHKISGAFASSKLCSCGYKYENLTPGIFHWKCPVCGKDNDRDFNAAQNICLQGLRELKLMR